MGFFSLLYISRVETSHDVWQFSVVLFVCLTGCLPWQKASSEDPRFVSYVYWLSSNGIMSPFRRPKLFKMLTSNAQRMFRKFLQPNVQTRPSVLDEVQHFIDERWLSKYMLDKSKGNISTCNYLYYLYVQFFFFLNVFYISWSNLLTNRIKYVKVKKFLGRNDSKLCAFNVHRTYIFLRT